MKISVIIYIASSVSYKGGIPPPSWKQIIILMYIYSVFLPFFGAFSSYFIMQPPLLSYTTIEICEFVHSHIHFPPPPPNENPMWNPG